MKILIPPPFLAVILMSKPILVILLTICALSPLIEGKEVPPGVDEALWETAQKAIPTEVERNQWLGRMYFLGINQGKLQIRKDYKIARRFFLKAAAMDDTRSKTHLGHIYFSGGFGVLADFREAAKWFRLAAVDGDAKAATCLGIMYNGGNGVPKNPKEGYKWCLRGAMGGDASAQRELGAMHVNGVGALQDYVTAYAWNNIAAANGNLDAEQMKKAMNKELTREQISKGQELSRKMVRENPSLMK